MLRQVFPEHGQYRSHIRSITTKRNTFVFDSVLYAVSRLGTSSANYSANSAGAANNESHRLLLCSKMIRTIQKGAAKPMKLLTMSSIVAMSFLFFQSRSVSFSAEKDVTISKDHHTTSIDCGGGSVSIKGDDNKITLTGQCSKVSVSGEDNLIQVASAKEVEITGHDNNINVDTVARITAKGKDNNIMWKNGVGGKTPEVSSKGDDNKILQAK
jgi:hypothetical protein